MSTDFRGLRPASNDPLLQIFTELQKRFAKFITTQQVELIDSDNEDIYSNGQDMESVIKYHTIQSEQRFDFNTIYYPTFEPDGNIVKVLLRGASLGNTLTDRSGFNNDASIYGDPTLVESTFDPGIHTSGTKSIAIRFNRQTSVNQNEEYLRISDTTDIRINSLVTGFSIFTRFRMKAIADQGGISCTIFVKTDDATPTNAYMLQVLTDGRLLFTVKKAGVLTAKYAAVGSILVNIDYDVFVTFAVSGSVEHIYINGVDKSLSSFVGTTNWPDITTNRDLYIFTRGANTSPRGSIYGDFYDFKYYKEKVVTSTEVTSHWNNKLTISPTAFGHCMITNYWAT
jgi:hypothetical protein